MKVNQIINHDITISSDYLSKNIYSITRHLLQIQAGKMIEFYILASLLRERKNELH